MTPLPLLSLLIFTPWAGALLLAIFPGLRAGTVRRVALGFSFSTLLLGLLLVAAFNPSRTEYQFSEQHAWIESLHVGFHLGLDGLSLVLVLLTALVAPAALWASAADRDARLHDSLFLVLQGSALGVFLALDFFPWFIFWELSLVPAFFLIRLWGGPGAGPAAQQFFVYTIGGSAFLLVGFVAMFAATNTFDFSELASLARHGELASRLGPTGGWIAFGGVLLGLAVKVPLFPFHTWLPPAYAEAPTGTTMFLTGVMSKMGVYGFLRLLRPFFPHELSTCATPLLWLALGGVVFGALAAMAQTDLKRMLAYSSVNHLGYCLLAIFAGGAAPENPAATAAALTGAVFQLFSHGVAAAALFLCVGVLAARSGGRRGLEDFGGVRAAMPVFAGLAGVALFSSLGLPGLNGFVGEFLIFRGVFGAAPWAAAVGCLGLLITAAFLLTFWQKVFHGPPTDAVKDFRDLDPATIGVLGAAAGLMIAFGVWPQGLVTLIGSFGQTGLMPGP